MAYTQHGHHIKGTVLEDRPEGLRTARCGGPHLCNDCAKDVARLAIENHKDKAPETTEEPNKVYYTKETIDKLYEVLNKSEILDVDQTFHVVNAMQESGFITKIQQKNQTPAIEDLLGTAVAGQELNDQQAVTAVFDALKRLGLSGPQIVSALNDMDNLGVVFRMEKD